MTTEVPSLAERIDRCFRIGLWSGLLFSSVISVDHLLWRFLEWYFPREDIDIAPDCVFIQS
jgi:phosphatidylinositol glycan class A protein